MPGWGTWAASAHAWSVKFQNAAKRCNQRSKSMSNLPPNYPTPNRWHNNHSRLPAVCLVRANSSRRSNRVTCVGRSGATGNSASSWISHQHTIGVLQYFEEWTRPRYKHWTFSKRSRHWKHTFHVTALPPLELPNELESPTKAGSKSPASTGEDLLDVRSILLDVRSILEDLLFFLQLLDFECFRSWLNSLCVLSAACTKSRISCWAPPGSEGPNLKLRWDLMRWDSIH